MIEALIGLAGVVVGSTITISKEVWTSWLARRRDGSYAAIRLICIFEEYADKCIDVVHDDGTAYGRPARRTESGEEYCEAQISTPDPLDFPDDIDWRSMPEPLMHRILALPNKARSTDRHVSASSEHAFPPDYEEFFEPRQRGYAQLGLDALEIADDLRQHFRISVRSRAELNTDWDPMAFLRKKTSTTEEAA
ncbi:conserved hypothetical protein [Agrobacterium fabacearum S56]|uniref:hypothetical protein n=1 Tax=Agrobacterium tumefaciens complex TaxID=1183400 RepID=UPI00088355CD|nr:MULTISPECIES: hypothetical protein [Agrobacterium tumefaciens complex]CUX03596.1 conserved hypothetical protein [Agrobacterium fabacearum S56]SDB69626.1 hypothetical protein SAMN03159422_03533 [Agrobacterium fabrum]SER69039.1 hypothetical protein SAMN03159504_03439 [Agrobacterium fabrum]